MKRITKIKDLEKYLKINKHEIIANKKCEIFIDKEDYEDSELQETPEYYILPGILEIHFPEDDVYITLPFDYDVHVYKPDNIINEKDYILLQYEPGDIIIKQKYKDTTINFNTIIKLFQGQVKFIKSPEQLVLLLSKQLDNKIDLVHLEVLVQQIYRCKDNEQKPCRLCGGNYKNCKIVSIPQLPYKLSWLLGLGFQNVNYAIKNALINKVPIKNTDLEKVILEY